MWEANNILTNFDPVSRHDGARPDRCRSLAGRSGHNNFGPRLGFAYTAMPETVIRGGWGISYVHFNRIGAANLLADQRPAGRQRRGQPVVRRRPASSPPSRAFRPASPTRRRSTRSPRSSATSRATSTRAPCRAGISACSASSAAHARRRRLRRQQSGRSAAGGELEPGLAEQHGGYDSAAARRPIPTCGDITYVFNGGKSRYDALPGQVRMAPRRRRRPPQLADAVESAGQWRRVARKSKRQLPGAAGHQQFRGRLRRVGLQPAYNWTTSFVW